MKNISDYILTFENVIASEICDRIVSEFSNEDEWEETKIDGGYVDDKIRSAKIIKLSFPYVIEKNPEVRTMLDHTIFASAGLAIRKYNEKFPSALIQQDSGYELLRYKEGQFYIEHTDSHKAMPRTISCSFILNDDYEGGEFAFFNQEIKYKLEKGSCIMFPSNFMYPHEIMPVKSGTRYSIVTWFI
jgi:predicted 2-oxoglutarate/Fe(II)-dependent dioxygenase YbiX